MPYNFDTLEFEPEIDPVTGKPKIDPNEYVKQKYGIGTPKPEQVEPPSELGGKVSGALAAIGAGFQGKDSFSAGNQAMANHRDSIKRSRESDPNSEESQFAKSAAKRMGYQGDVSGLTAEKFKSISPVMEKMYEIEQKKLDRQEARDERRFQQGIKLDEKREERMTTFGEARTPDDAKKLKEAAVTKDKFDSALDDMIALRKKHGGGNMMNREDVARGKQLSRDLLLAKKNLENLGVLSKSDEAIVNAIIPEDPLAFRSAVETAQGQDSILSNMEKFKTDSSKSFQAGLRERLRNGPPSEKKIAKTQTNQKTGAKKIIYTDGTEEIIPATKVAGGR